MGHLSHLATAAEVLAKFCDIFNPYQGSCGSAGGYGLKTPRRTPSPLKLNINDMRHVLERRSGHGLQSPEDGSGAEGKADAEAAARRAADAQVLADAEKLIAAWNERQARRMPLLFAPTIGAALASRHHFLWVDFPARRTTRDIDLRALDRHREAAVMSLIPSLSCRSRRPNTPSPKSCAVQNQHR